MTTCEQIPQSFQLESLAQRKDEARALRDLAYALLEQDADTYAVSFEAKGYMGHAGHPRREMFARACRTVVALDRATSAEGLDKVTFRPTGRGGWQIHIVYKRGHGGYFCGSEWDVDAKTLFDAWEAAGE